MTGTQNGPERGPVGAESFGERLRRAVDSHGPVVAGIDPHPSLLEAWSLPDTPEGLRQFSRSALSAVQGEVAAIKPQSAFFERHGSAGVAVLEELLAVAREIGVLSILDVKRGDIGSTMSAYAQTHLLPGAPLEADAITASPYLGAGSLDPAAELAAAHGKGLFLLALTSNPDGPQVQHARTAADTPVALEIARHAEEIGAGRPGEWSSVGLVVGATVGDAYRRLGLDRAAPSVPLLAPGFGAQGAGPDQLTEVFGENAGHVLVSLSRGLLSAGPVEAALRARAQTLRALYS
ncbi:orotidine-5'-phosphate decarboxylase [Brachybacterium sp.]|uniref:orotidine-5'-phosphate decarboxylase n=1 Tax=Brachybacterium sp. TaxID=1891286 RepID=UPI002ED15B84